MQCHEAGTRASWKLRTLLRTLKFHNLEAVFAQYKSQVLPTLEFCTPAVCHCTASTLEELDKVQRRFLQEVRVSTEDALLLYNLARRYMAMLGVIYRTVLKKGPPQFQQWFYATSRQVPVHNTRRQERLHTKQLHDWLAKRDTETLRRSALGLVRVYNELPQEAVDATSVKDFQSWLQDHLKELASKELDNWENTFNLRKKSWRQKTVRKPEVCKA